MPESYLSPCRLPFNHTCLQRSFHLSTPDADPDLVSGFVEFGECLEEAAVREVREETGVRVGNLRYVGSQCWPFPSQLMAGFIADYVDGELQVDRQELEDARWVPLDALPGLPPPCSISRYILDKYLAG